MLNTNLGLSIDTLKQYTINMIDKCENILDLSIQDPNSVSSTFKSNYLDSHGAYMIMELNYTFQNRGNIFEINIRARALDIIKNVTGATI